MQLINEQRKQSKWKIKRKINSGPAVFFLALAQNFSHKNGYVHI